MDAESTTDGLTLAQHVARAQGTRQRLVDELRDLVAVEQGIYEDLKAQADQAKGRRDGYQRALDHIQGAAKVAAAAPKSPKKKSALWAPSEDKIDMVWQAIREASAQGPDPITQTTLVGELPMGADTVRKAFEVLRERELIRVAGRARGGGKLWALMPASPDEGLTVAA
jgi:hypothetical protein